MIPSTLRAVLSLVRRPPSARSVLGKQPFVVLRIAAGASTALLAAAAIAAEPTLTTVFPTSCTRGASVDVQLIGKGVEQGGELHFTVAGVRGEHIEKNRFRVTVAESARCEDCDLWVATPDGLAGPRRFSITALPVVVESEKTDGRADNNSPERAQTIPLPCAVEGKADAAADIDWYRFQGKQGQLLTVQGRSVSLDGSFEPVLTLCDAEGRELAFSSAGDVEPTVALRLPETGEYLLRIHERAFQRDDYSAYRLELGMGPRLSAVFPHVIAKGAAPPLQMVGWGWKSSGDEDSAKRAFRGSLAPRLAPRPLMTTDALQWSPAPLRSAGVWQDLRVARALDATGAAQVRIGALPVVVEQPSETAARCGLGQRLKETPCRVAGRFLQTSEIDWYLFAASKGEKFFVEAVGERLGQRMDLELVICDRDGKPLETFSDTAAVKGAPAFAPTETLDPMATWTSPADGDYRLAVRDLYGGSVFGPGRRYELRLEHVGPRFSAVVEAGESLQPGSTGELSVAILRQAGFAGAVTIREANVEGLDAHGDGEGPLALAPLTIKAKEISASLKIAVKDDAKPGFYVLRLLAEPAEDPETSRDQFPVEALPAAVIRDGLTRRVDQLIVHVRK